MLDWVRSWTKASRCPSQLSRSTMHCREVDVTSFFDRPPHHCSGSRALGPLEARKAFARASMAWQQWKQPSSWRLRCILATFFCILTYLLEFRRNCSLLHRIICVGSSGCSFNDSANSVSKRWGTVDAGSTTPTRPAGDMLPGSSQRLWRRRQGRLLSLRTSYTSRHTLSFLRRLGMVSSGPFRCSASCVRPGPRLARKATLRWDRAGACEAQECARLKAEKRILQRAKAEQATFRDTHFGRRDKVLVG
jgi:hypothetical protein